MAWRYRLGQSSTRRHQRDVEKDNRRLTPNGGFKNTKMARHRSAKRADGSSRVWRCVGEWIRCAAGIRNADMSILRKNWTRTLSENIRSAGKRRNISSSIKTKQATAVELQEDQPEDQPIAPPFEQAETSIPIPADPAITPADLNEPAIPAPSTAIEEEPHDGECVGNLYQRRAGARQVKLTRRPQANLRGER